MAKRSVDPVNKRKSTRNTAAITQISNSHEATARQRQSTGHFSSGAAPRVGSDKKKGTVTVAKPSRVQSGIKLKKKR